MEFFENSSNIKMAMNNERNVSPFTDSQPPSPLSTAASDQTTPQPAPTTAMNKANPFSIDYILSSPDPPTTTTTTSSSSEAETNSIVMFILNSLQQQANSYINQFNNQSNLSTVSLVQNNPLNLVNHHQQANNFNSIRQSSQDNSGCLNDGPFKCSPRQQQFLQQTAGASVAAVAAAAADTRAQSQHLLAANRARNRLAAAVEKQNNQSNHDNHRHHSQPTTLMPQFLSASTAFPWTVAARGKPRRGMMRRAVFSDGQRVGLEKRFQLQKYISKPDRKKLAEKLGLRDSQVKIWFQNRRMKWRNSKERELLSAGGSREQTLPTRNNPNPDLSDVGETIKRLQTTTTVVDNSQQTNTSSSTPTVNSSSSKK